MATLNLVSEETCTAPIGNRLKLSFATLQKAQTHDYAALDSTVRSMYISSDKEIVMTTVEAIRNRSMR